MTQPYAGLGLWVWGEQQTNADMICRALAENHGAWVAIKTHDGTSPFNTRAGIEAYAIAARKHGLKFGIWGYLAGDHPAAEAKIAAQHVSEYLAQFYIADAEIGYESAHGDSALFCKTFRALHPKSPAALSSFGRVDFHNINWKAWASAGFDWMPQAYECESAQLSPAKCIEASRAIWDAHRVYPTLGTYKGALGVLSGGELYDSVKSLGLPGVNLWDAQELHSGQLEALGHLVKGTSPHPKPPHGHKLLFPMNPRRALKLTTPLTRGDDVRDLQIALGIWAKNHGLPPVRADGQFGELAKHATGVVAYAMGLVDTSASKDTIRLIWHPWLRTPTERKRSHRRQAAASHGGLANLPKLAAKYIGVHENPAGSNEGYPYPSHWEENFGMNGVYWCGCFAGSIANDGGGHMTDRVASCPDIKADAEAHTNGFDAWTTDHTQAGPGWFALYCWNGSGVPEHVGIAESFTTTGPVTIEGNTSGTNPSDGGMVAREQRNYSNVVGYARPRL